jgi:predicted Mrr-cat superfamily restriction endonuclease
LIWRLVAHHHSDDGSSDFPELGVQWILSKSRIAIGWSHIGDLSNFTSADRISASTLRVYPQNRNASVSGPQLWAFKNEMKRDDLVIVSANRKRRLVARVTGEYEFDPHFPPDERIYGHQRQVQVTKLNADEVWKASGGMALGQSQFWTLIRCRAHPASLR